MFLGIDIGTSGVKAVLLDDSGALRAQHSAPLTVSRPRHLWSEQDPDSWWAATGAAVRGLPSKLRSQVRGIGLAGQMHGATLLGSDDRPLRPAILWNDGRSFAECTALETRVPRLRGITGNMAMPGFTAPKIEWVRRHEAELFSRLRTVLLPKDYVRLCMTGEKACDMSDSAGTLWLDVGRRDWSDAMLDATGLSRGHMPRLFEGPEPTGTLRPAVAAEWGMAAVPVVAGGGDNAAGAAGIGVIEDGDALISLGTSGVIFVATRHFQPNPERAVHAFCHCLPDLWHQMSVHLSAASCVEWAARFAGVDVPAFFAAAEKAGPASGPELFLPYLSGERTPHNDQSVRGAFLGLNHDTDLGRLASAVLEGVAFALADGLAALHEAGAKVDIFSVIGGGARSAYWGEILAAALRTPLQYIDGGDVGPALGAAKLALMGIEGLDAAAACPPAAVQRRIEPDAQAAARLAPKLDRFRSAYHAIRDF